MVTPLRWSRLTTGNYRAHDDEGTVYDIIREPYGRGHSFTARHHGKTVGFTRRSLALAKRDAQQHANGLRPNVATTDPGFASRPDAPCLCPVREGTR